MSTIVGYGRRSRFSGRVLNRALISAGYGGKKINFGFPVYDNAINDSGAIRLYSNKRRALEKMRDEGVPVPELYNKSVQFPCIGRPDRHFAGRGLYLCTNYPQFVIAQKRGCTHFMKYIENGREFRVHVAFGKSIKIAEKVGGTGIARNHKNGWFFGYPQEFNRKITLRNTAKKAVEALGLDFGAVDIIYKDDEFYVLEVNTAPSLTSNSDILERYVKAFKEHNNEYYYD